MRRSLLFAYALPVPLFLAGGLFLQFATDAAAPVYLTQYGLALVLGLINFGNWLDTKDSQE